jgi:hypothetical protein
MLSPWTESWLYILLNIYLPYARTDALAQHPHGQHGIHHILTAKKELGQPYKARREAYLDIKCIRK